MPPKTPKVKVLIIPLKVVQLYGRSISKYFLKDLEQQGLTLSENGIDNLKNYADLVLNGNSFKNDEQRNTLRKLNSKVGLVDLNRNCRMIEHLASRALAMDIGVPSDITPAYTFNHNPDDSSLSVIGFVEKGCRDWVYEFTQDLPSELQAFWDNQVRTPNPSNIVDGYLILWQKEPYLETVAKGLAYRPI